MSNAPRARNAHRDWGSDDSGASIMHVDMDAFFASVEVARRPALRGKPVVVGGGDRAVVLAATYEARDLGVKSAMPVARAKVLAPQAIFVQPDHRTYYKVSTRVMEILNSITPEIEQVSVDEAFLDISGARRLWGSALEIGAKIRRQVESEFGVTCSIGIGKNKFVAKLASTNCKPNGLMLVPAHRTVEFVQCLPVGALWGVGEKTRAKLEGWGITQVSELAQLDIPTLRRMVGAAAASHLHALSWGEDDRAVQTSRTEKSIGAETTFEHDTNDQSILERTFWALADECGSRVRARQMVGRTIAIKVRNSNFETQSKSITLKSPVSGTKEIFEAARELFSSMKRQQTIRLLGIRIENLEKLQHANFQDTLLDSVSGTSVVQSRSEQVIDEIRAKFGQTSIERAAQSGIRLSRLK